MQLDQTDYQILRLLTENSRIQWKDLGGQIHMTGQAVGNRIKKLEESGVITAYSLIIDEMKLGLVFTAFVIIHMKTANHDSFIRFITDQNEVVEAHRISGEGCYHLTIKVSSQDQLNLFLNKLLDYGNYSLNLSIQKIKQSSTLSAALNK
ncbi:transcriptional regulator [Brevibacillus borstelensis AK1]|jgi:Lrp/AsnC family transcriptional regulator, leucine-responsive regulatory protein|uniref:Transcriptional regulator n=1 Tax=Brevibacillus borstelensis AK1 TaxID=1300222 RepID=M8DAN2_9BACL|nr:Lrp/AsnC family transcriptional regulator [Brevibacillus borstelensis]EMT50438.1 transcriptional regulator [Brevibacillus borstelensis AK1]KKX53383.1 transcriptional regulator [Brevibacillus borstelensis cifa_chp40]